MEEEESQVAVVCCSTDGTAPKVVAAAAPAFLLEDGYKEVDKTPIIVSTTNAKSECE